MNNVMHTGGPWIADGHSVRRLIGTIPSVVIATTEGPPDVAEANARLIAAAPDLLNTCHALLSAHRDPQDAARQARAAIAKAEGRTE